MKFKSSFRKKLLAARQKGLTTVEYAVAGALIVTGLVASFAALGGRVQAVIDAIL